MSFGCYAELRDVMPLQFNRLGITQSLFLISSSGLSRSHTYQIVYILRVLVKGEVKLLEAKSSTAMPSLLLPTMKSQLLATLSGSILSQDYLES